MENFHVMDKLFAFDDRLELNNVTLFIRVVELLNLAVVGGVGIWYFHIFENNINVLNVAYG